MVIKIRNSLFNIIYKKAIISTSLPEGTGINLIEIDAERVCEFFRSWPWLIMDPIKITVGLFIIYNQVGDAV